MADQLRENSSSKLFNFAYILLKTSSGMSLGASFVLLFSAIILPHHIFFITLCATLFGGINYGFRATNKIKERKSRLQNIMINPHFQESSSLSIAPKHPIVLNLIKFFASGVSLLGIFFFISPKSVLLLSAIDKIILSAIMGCIILFFSYLYKYILKPRINHATQSKVVSANENIHLLYSFLVLHGILRFLSNTSCIFGILLLFCVNFHLSLAWINPTTALLIASSFSLIDTILNTLHLHEQNRTKLKTNGEETANEPLKWITGLLKTKKFQEMKMMADNMLSMFNGASNGIGCVTTVLSILLFSPVNPSLGVCITFAFSAALIFGLLSFAVHCAKKSDREKAENAFAHQNRSTITSLVLPPSPAANNVSKHEQYQTPTNSPLSGDPSNSGQDKATTPEASNIKHPDEFPTPCTSAPSSPTKFRLT